MSFALRARDVAGTRMTQWLVGMLATSSFLNDVDTVVNSAPQAYQVSTITIDTVTNSATYTVTINGIDVSYTADASAVNTEIVAGLIAAIEQDPATGGSVTCAATSATVITLTGRTAGEVFTLTDSDAKITCATTTAADDADPIGFGLLLIDEGTDSDGSRLGSLAKSSSLTAQVDTITFTYAAGEVYYVDIAMVDGSAPKSVAVAADTDTATTATAIYNAINAIMPANTVVATNPSSGVVVLTAEVAGKAFVTGIGLKSGTIARAALVNTTSGVDTDINRAALGISVHTYDEESTTAGVSTPSYPGNAGVKTLRKGDIAVECSETVTFGLPVYVELGVTADNGKFFVASSATRVRLNRAIWVRDEQSGADNEVAILRLQ